MKKTNFNIVGKFGTILADPPWEFKNKTGKIAPQYKKTNRYNKTCKKKCSIYALFACSQRGRS